MQYEANRNVLDYILSPEMQYSHCDQIIRCWLEFTCYNRKYKRNVHHILLLLVIGYHQLCIEQQILFGDEKPWNTVHKTPAEVGRYRFNHVRRLIDGTEYNEVDWHRHANIIRAAPLAPTASINNYHFRRRMAEKHLWPYSIARYNLDEMKRFNDENDINEKYRTLEHWLSGNLEQNVEKYLRFIYEKLY